MLSSFINLAESIWEYELSVPETLVLLMVLVNILVFLIYKIKKGEKKND